MEVDEKGDGSFEFDFAATSADFMEFSALEEKERAEGPRLLVTRTRIMIMTFCSLK